MAVAASWLATAWDQNAALHNTSPVAAKLEEIALQWTLSLLRLPATCGGGFVTGTGEAHITALTAARNEVRPIWQGTFAMRMCIFLQDNRRGCRACCCPHH